MTNREPLIHEILAKISNEDILALVQLVSDDLHRAVYEEALARMKKLNKPKVEPAKNSPPKESTISPAEVRAMAVTAVENAKNSLAKKRGMSTAGRKAISDAQKKRWAAWHKKNKKK